MTKTKIFIVCASLFLFGAACTTSTLGGSTDGGLWVSSDKGETWNQRVNIYTDRTMQKTISNIDIKKIVFSPTDSRKIFAITEKNGLWISWNGGYNWDSSLSNIYASDIAINPINPQKIYAAIGDKIAMSIDEGVKWKSVYVSDSETKKIKSIALDPSNPDIIYASTNMNTILISQDGGIFWSVYAELGNGIVLESMRFHPYEQDALYAIDAGKGLAKSKDKGKTWSFFDIDGTPRDYEFTPTGIIYASSAGLFRTLNSGDDWSKLPIISGKGESNIYSVAVNPKNPLEIFYGTKSTLYYSSDGGFNWVPRELPTTWTALEIVFHPEKTDEIYLGAGRIKQQ